MRSSLRVLLAASAALVVTPPTLPSQAPTELLQARVRERIANVPGAVVAVSFRDLERGTKFDLNGDSVFHAASTMKVPVMIEYFRAVDEGRIAPDYQLPLVNQFASIVDGSPYSLTPGDDSDSALYQLIGKPVASRELVDRMITRSSNLATNAVIALVGAERANATARGLGASRIKVLRGVEDGKAFERGLNNTTTAPDLAALLEAIELRRAASAASSKEMLGILERQEFNAEIPAGLPAGTRVAHKTGWITGVLHDAALVYPPERAPYVLVVLTRGIPDEKAARALIVGISREVWGVATQRP